MIPKPIAVAVRRINESSSQLRSNKLASDIITPFTCLQFGEIHRKALREPTFTLYW
jgi:hypothetical protein